MSGILRGQILAGRRAGLALAGLAALGPAALGPAAGLAALATTASALAGCGSSDPAKADAIPDNFDRNALLAHLGEHVLLPIQATFDARANALPAAIAAYCDALDAGTPGTTLESARAAWREAIDAWQHAEALLVGPAAMDNKALRDRIYAWPLLAPCDVDRDVASRWANPASYDVSTKLQRQRSLLAIEYLLFPQTDAHNCAITPPGWDALGADLLRARCRLAEVLATDVAAAATTLHTAWRADGGNYVGELARAGMGTSIPSAHAGVNLVSDSFFYVDRMVKDMKLAEAAGIAVNACGTVQEPCIREVELRFADRATTAIRINLATLREAITGTTPAADGPGFDDFLIAIGQPEVATRVTAALDAAIAKADALPESFLGALTNDYAAIVEAHAATKEFTNDLKSQFLTLLALDIPDDVASDND
ncbi:MAG TPA: imelysin family protein [Kofleriaceae bacterium]|nr:imelysin family protein [Kofleriaceae bacterium]